MERFAPAISPLSPAPRPLRLRDAFLVAIFSFALFGYCGISGRPLTMHEARLPQTSREMLSNRDWPARGGIAARVDRWLLPRSGSRPWLERPPLPHWIVIGSIELFARRDAIIPEWVVRLPSAVMGTITVVLTALMAGWWFGRSVGVMSGLLLASSFEFYAYAGSAEDDIYLAALVAAAMAAFALAEFHPRFAGDARVHFAVGRAWPVLLFFLLSGLTNWTKGPLLGLAVIGSSAGAWLLWNALAEGAWRRWLRYLWLWGWLAAGALTLAWPLWAYHRYPDVLENWKYDYVGRMNGAYSDINQPWYYYLKTILWTMAPWTPACLIGLTATAGRALRRGPGPPGATKVSPPVLATSPPSSSLATTHACRLVWCWAIAPLVVFSIPHGKHHHYLLPFLAPWAVLGAFGLVEIARLLLARKGPRWMRDPWVALVIFGLPVVAAMGWFHERIPGPARLDLAMMVGWTAAVAVFFVGLRRGSGRIVLGVALAVVFGAYCWAETFVAAGTDRTVDDTAFLRRARGEVPGDVPLFINARLGPIGNLDFFRIQFYSRPDAVLLHNLSYLRDEKIRVRQVYVISRLGDRARLGTLGQVRVIDQSVRSHEQKPGGPFALFLLTFDPKLRRYPADQRITPMQAMERGPAGPWCGPGM